MTQKKTGDQIHNAWPVLPAPAEWEKSLESVHLWSQIIGKIRMENTPGSNHSWHVTLYVSSRGLTTSLIPHPSGAFGIEFNFADHKLELQKVNGMRVAFDLAATRFSGRPAPNHPGGVPNCPDWVMVEAYSHELSSAGFWPGTGLGEAAFYSYAYPEPAGFKTADILPQEAWYSEELGEYLLSYETVQKAPNPDDVLLQFLKSTYEAAAINGNWDRKSLEKNT